MQVKIFEAEDMASGLRQIRRELGPDALILSTRTVKNSKLGILGKGHLEITAAIDNTPPGKPNQADKAKRSQASKIYRNNSSPDTSPAGSPAESSREAPAESPPLPLQPAEGDGDTAGDDTVFQGNQDRQEQEDDPALRREFDELKDMVKHLAGELSRIGSQPAPPQTPAKAPVASLEQKLRASNRTSPIEDILLGAGIDNDTAKIISSFAGERLDQADLLDDAKIYSFLHETLADIVTVNTPDFRAGTKQRRMALIGPTGVGKTTTLAKIAAKFLAEKSKSIAFITVDTYRIAAVEQLKVYGEIMHLPVEVVITPQQLTEALTKHDDKELILIDTAGRSPQDSLGIEEIQGYFTDDLEIENYLVLSATTRDNELIKIYNQFDQVPVHGTIFTKIDECTTLGTILNMQVHAGKPLTYLTKGQRVPEDILEADKNQLAHLIIPFAGGIAHE